MLLLVSCHKNKIKSSSSINNSHYDKAWYYLDQKNQDSAFLYFSKVNSYNTDSLLIAKSHANMAIIQCDQGDYFGCVETAIKSIDYFKTDSPYLPAVYNTIAIAKYNLRDYKNSFLWYEKATNTCTDSLNCLLYRNNLAVSLVEDKRYNSAILIFQKLLDNDIIKSNKEKFSQTLDNFIWAKWLQNPAYNATPELLKALNIREKENDLWGQNASYAHLADYYTKKQQDSALFYANKMYSVSKKIKSPDDQLEALQKLIKLSPPKETRQYFEIYQKLDDSVQTARNAAKNQFALIRYETEKHKADNLTLQKENTEKTYQLILLIGTGILSSIVGVILYKKRKQRLEAAAQNAIRENQLKTSKKVHDVVANGLYRIMSKLENQDILEDDAILDEMEDLYERSRDISYEKPPLSDPNFNKKLSSLLTSFTTETTRVFITGNSADLWKKINVQVKYEVEHVLQELMVNMKKHSQANKVTVQFEQKNNQINIYYTDNGIGISEGTLFNNGLTNTGNRIKSIQGTIIFDKKVEKGLKIRISFPVS